MESDKNIRLYYLASALDGFRFLIPIWLIWYTRFIPMSTVGFMEAIGIIISTILEVPTGAFADIVGRRRSVILGKIGVAMGAFLVAFAANSSWLISGIIVWNIFGAFISGSNTALIYDHLLLRGRESDFPKISARATTIMRLGVIFASFTGGMLFNLWSALPYFLFGITSIMETLVWYFMDEPVIDSHKFSWMKYRQMITNGFQSITHSPKMTLISSVSITIITLGILFREYFNYSYALDLNISADGQSLLFGVSGILKMLSVLLVGQLILRYSQNIITYLFLIFTSAILIPSMGAGFIGGIVIILLVELVTAASPIISDTYLNREIDSRQRATAISFINMFSSLILAIILLIGMYLIDIFKSPTIFTASGIILLFTTLMFLFIQRNITKTN